MSSDDELRRATVFLERLLEDPQLRADFRRRPAKTCRAFELDGLADELDSGERGTATLELRESRSGLAGVMIGVAAEGLGLAELLARHASDLGNASASDLIARLGGGPDNAQAAAPGAAPVPAGAATTAAGAPLPADPNAMAAAPPAAGAPAAGLPATSQPGGAEAAAGLPAAYPSATAQAAAAPSAAAPPAGLPAAQPAPAAPGAPDPAGPPAAAGSAVAQPAGAPAAAEPAAQPAAAPPTTGQAITEPATESPATAQPAAGQPAAPAPEGAGLPAQQPPPAAAQPAGLPPTPAEAEPAAPAPAAGPPVTAAALAADARAIDPDAVVESSGQRAVELAKQHLGESYVWGGASPQTGFDCSGLVQYVYSQVGVQLPRVTQDQIGVGQPIGLSELRTGDMVFFRDPSGDVHHVGLYLDHGRFLHAPHTGDVIKISSLDEPYYASQFTGGRRVGEVAAAIHDVNVIRRSAGEIAARANDARVMPVLDPSAPRPGR